MLHCVLKYAPLKGGGCGERLFGVHEENQLFMNVGHPARRPDQTFDEGAYCQIIFMSVSTNVCFGQVCKISSDFVSNSKCLMSLAIFICVLKQRGNASQKRNKEF